jgi:hypothetical protein
VGADDTVIEGNSISGSTYGIALDSGIDNPADDNRIARNTLSGNGTGIYFTGIRQTSKNNLLLQNRITGNRDDGILLEEVFRQNTLIEGNTLARNGDDGIDVDNAGAIPNRLGANSANENGDLGIEAAVGVGDLGGNQAQGNANTGQCTNVHCDRSGRALFGKRISGSSFSSMSGDVKRASVFPFYFSGTVNKLTAFLDGGGAASGSQALRGVIYHRAPGGGPGPLVARSFQGMIAAGRPPGWVGFYFPFPPRLAPGVYWLGLHSGQASRVARFAWDAVAGSRWFNGDSYSNGPSNPFGSAATDTQQMSIYASGSY